MSIPGTPGYCKLCESAWLPKINEKIAEDWNSKQVEEWVLEVSGGSLTFNRQTFYAHKNNKGGKHRLGTAVRQAPPPDYSREGAGGRPPAPSSNDEFLEFIRDHSMEQLRETPGLITPKMGMEAVKILEARKAQNTQVLVLARVLTGQVQPPQIAAKADVIEGEFTELPASSEPVQIGVTES